MFLHWRWHTLLYHQFEQAFRCAGGVPGTTCFVLPLALEGVQKLVRAFVVFHSFTFQLRGVHPLWEVLPHCCPDVISLLATSSTVLPVTTIFELSNNEDVSSFPATCMSNAFMYPGESLIPPVFSSRTVIPLLAPSVICQLSHVHY